MLDFGCGAGRTLRNFLDVAHDGELHGCDIFGAGVRWVGEHLMPPVHAFASREEPPLELADGAVDLIYALSVFTHITDSWADWLCELHRVLAPGGRLIATFVEDVNDPLVARADPETDIGMNVIRHHHAWDQGGPIVLHSDWWLREHWGRAFELVEMDREPVHERLAAHRWGLFQRRDDVSPTPEALRGVDGHDPREFAALQFNLRQAQAEIVNWRRRATVAREHYEGSLSWRATRPLRAAGRLLRRGRS